MWNLFCWKAIARHVRQSYWLGSALTWSHVSDSMLFTSFDILYAMLTNISTHCNGYFML